VFLATGIDMKNSAYGQPLAPTMVSNTTDTLSVTGTATSEIQPDKVQVNFAIQTMNETAGSALRANSEATSKVITALNGIGIHNDAIHNAYFSIYPNYNVQQLGGSSLAAGYALTKTLLLDSQTTPNGVKLTGYTVTNSSMVESKSLSSVSRLVDMALAAGATRVDGIFFTVSDTKAEQIRANLTQEAIANSKIKANALANALGVKIIGIQAASLNDFIYAGNQPPSSVGTATASAVSPNMQSPIITGEQAVTASVTVIYKIT
jgi:uncharacterized protein YggE